MKIIGLGDIHHPFADYDKIEDVAEFAVKFKPDVVIQVGDLYDMYGFSDFSKNPNFITPAEEERQGREKAVAMWKMFKEAAPKAKRYQIGGNHDIRPVKRAAENLPASLHVMKKHLKELMTFDGVELVSAEHEIDGIVFQHGDERKGQAGTCSKYNQQNTVMGHTHKPWVVWDQNRHGPFFEMNVGWLGDHTSEAFDYRAQKKLHKMINAFGTIDDGNPMVYILK